MTPNALNSPAPQTRRRPCRPLAAEVAELEAEVAELEDLAAEVAELEDLAAEVATVREVAMETAKALEAQLSCHQARCLTVVVTC